MKIVLVHGIFDDGRLFKKMAASLRDLECEVYIPSLKPADARLGVMDLAIKLKAYIDVQLEADDDFLLIGFSMGCLVSRYYLQALGGHHRCKIFHAISGPHAGSRLAHLFFGQGAKDLRPHSKLIQQLNMSEDVLAAMKVYSYRTRYDQMIIPSSSSHWDIAENHLCKAFIHRLMLQDPLVLNVIAKSIAALRKESGLVVSAD